MEKKKIAVILSGCGNRDGAEIHESTLTLWAIHRHGADFQCFAPDIPMYHVLNFITGEEMNERRNVLVESARIARGDIRDLKEFNQEEFDALILPGGLGAAKNLSTYAFDGPECTVNEDVARAIRDMHAAGKPIGALCIAPVLLARVLGTGNLTVGQDESVGHHLSAMGATPSPTGHGEIVIDRENRLVTTPCYMLDARVDQIGEGADNLVRAILELTD
ncbi:MAG: isoprenoid biosynthesis glyoxalase ElbB [Desulfobulbaceae bacterium]